MVHTRKLSAVTSSGSPTSPHTRSPEKVRHAMSSNSYGNDGILTISEVQDRKFPKSSSPYNYGDACDSDKEDQQPLIGGDDHIWTLENNASIPGYIVPTTSSSSGHLTAQGWHSINDPNNPRSCVLVSSSTEQDSEEEAYMKLDIWAGNIPHDDTFSSSSPVHFESHDLFESDTDCDTRQELRGYKKVDRDKNGSKETGSPGNMVSESRKIIKVPSPNHYLKQGHMEGPSKEIDAYEKSDGDTVECHWDVLGGDEASPRIGIPATDKPTIRLVHKLTSVEKVAHFKKMPENEIDWNNKSHIKAISMWRRQFFRRHAFPLRKKNVFYTHDEEAFLIYVHRKIKSAMASSTTIRAPGTAAILDAFNQFFTIKTRIDTNGKTIAPRTHRDEKSFNAKLNRPLSELHQLRVDCQTSPRSILRGDIYMPVITEEDIRQFRAMQADDRETPIELSPASSGYS